MLQRRPWQFPYYLAIFLPLFTLRQMSAPTLTVLATVAFAAALQTTTSTKSPSEAFRSRPSELRNVWDGVYSQKQAERGEKIYVLSCSSCHGEKLEGIDDAPPLVGQPFLSSWGGSSVADLFERIRTTMPTGSVGTLSAQQVADVIAYQFQFNKFPAGSAELAASADSTADITITAEKP